MTRLQTAAVTGLLAVALGAFGAHGLRSVLEQHETTEIWKTASQYHLVHAVVLLWLAGREAAPRSLFVVFLAGIVIFSGSLYVLAVTGLRWLGAITTIGGVLLMIGWAGIAVTAGKKSS